MIDRDKLLELLDINDQQIRDLMYLADKDRAQQRDRKLLIGVPRYLGEMYGMPMYLDTGIHSGEVLLAASVEKRYKLR